MTVVLNAVAIYKHETLAFLLSHFVQMLRVTELFMPSHQLLPLFSPLGYTKASLLEQSAVREAVTRYVKSNELASKRCCNNISNSTFWLVWDCQLYHLCGIQSSDFLVFYTIIANVILIASCTEHSTNAHAVLYIDTSEILVSSM